MLDGKTIAAGPFSRVEPRTGRTYDPFRPARPLRDWIVDGAVVEGHEANKTAFPFHVLESINRPGVSEYVVLGVERFDDGAWFLDFGTSREYIEATTDFRDRDGLLVWTCPDCDGVNDDHRRIEIPDPSGGRSQWVRCPRDTRGRR